MEKPTYSFNEGQTNNENNPQPVYMISYNDLEQNRWRDEHNEQRVQHRQPCHESNRQSKVVTKLNHINTKKITVFISSFLSVTLCAGIVFNMSVLNNEWMEYFQKSKAETSLIQSIAIGLVGIGGFPSGLAVAKFGPMKVGIIAGCILGLGLCSSFFATDVLFLVVTIGIIAGSGFSLAFNSAFTSISQHFKGRQATMVLAVASFGSGLGGMFTPTLLQLCINMYTWRGTTLIFGGLALNISAWAFTYKTATISDRNATPKTKTCSGVMKSLMSNGLFICFIIAISMISVLNSVLVFLVDYLESCGMTRQQAINIYFWMTVTSTISRLTPGIFKFLPHVSTLSLPVGYTALAAVALALLPYFKTRTSLTFAACCFGASWGGLISVNTILVLKLVPRDKFSIAFGIRGAAIGIAGILAVPISGHLRDISGDYNLTFYSSSVTMAVSCVLFTGIFVYKSVSKRNQKDKSNESTCKEDL